MSNTEASSEREAFTGPFRDKLTGWEETPPANGWVEIEAILDRKKRRFAAWLWFSGGVLLLLLPVAWFILQGNRTQTVTSSQTPEDQLALSDQAPAIAPALPDSVLQAQDDAATRRQPSVHTEQPATQATPSDATRDTQATADFTRENDGRVETPSTSNTATTGMHADTAGDQQASRVVGEQDESMSYAIENDQPGLTRANNTAGQAVEAHHHDTDTVTAYGETPAPRIVSTPTDRRATGVSIIVGQTNETAADHSATQPQRNRYTETADSTQHDGINQNTTADAQRGHLTEGKAYDHADTRANQRLAERQESMDATDSLPADRHAPATHVALVPGHEKGMPADGTHETGNTAGDTPGQTKDTYVTKQEASSSPDGDKAASVSHPDSISGLPHTSVTTTPTPGVSPRNTSDDRAANQTSDTGDAAHQGERREALNQQPAAAVETESSSSSSAAEEEKAASKEKQEPEEAEQEPEEDEAEATPAKWYWQPTAGLAYTFKRIDPTVDMVSIEGLKNKNVASWKNVGYHLGINVRRILGAKTYLLGGISWQMLREYSNYQYKPVIEDVTEVSNVTTTSFSVSTESYTRTNEVHNTTQYLTFRLGVMQSVNLLGQERNLLLEGSFLRAVTHTYKGNAAGHTFAPRTQVFSVKAGVESLIPLNTQWTMTLMPYIAHTLNSSYSAESIYQLKMINIGVSAGFLIPFKRKEEE